MTEEEILSRTSARIEQHRKGVASFTVNDAEGNPLQDVSVTIEQIRHDFLFGSNIFGWQQDETDLQDIYRQRFAELLNYATLPFYWWGFEPEQGKPSYEYIDQIIAWCQEHDITCKGHPLVWNHNAARWLPDDLDEIKRLSYARVAEIVERYKGRINIWDVVNEAVDPGRFDNLMTKAWMHHGRIPMTVESFLIARKANHDATLLINDYRADDAYVDLIKQLQDKHANRVYDVIGIQSHMHRGVWPVERIWEVCERFAQFGVPLHFTETTVVSGPRAENAWETTLQGEIGQKNSVERFYTVLFSHPAVEAITWWDFSDLHAWQGAPAGFLRKDMSPKPVYEWLMSHIKSKWWTNIQCQMNFRGRSKGDGSVALRCFYGKYRITATTKDRDGKTVSKEVHIKKGAENQFTLVI